MSKVLLLLALFFLSCNNKGDPGDSEDSTSNESVEPQKTIVDTLKIDTLKR